MLYTVIEKDPKKKKETVVIETNDKQEADALIESNSCCYIKYDKKAISKVDAPIVKSRRDMSPIETIHRRSFPNSVSEEQRKAEYDVYNNV